MRLMLIAMAMAMLSALASAQGNCTSFLILANTFPASIASGDATESLSVSIVSGECIITGDITWTPAVTSCATSTDWSVSNSFFLDSNQGIFGMANASSPNVYGAGYSTTNCSSTTNSSYFVGVNDCNTGSQLLLAYITIGCR